MLQNTPYWIIGFFLIFSAIGILSLRKPVHASLSFLLTLFMLAVLYLLLSAEFVAVLQVLVYAGAILVIFMFVIVLFQDAHEQLELLKAKSSFIFTWAAALLFFSAFVYFANQLIGVNALVHAKEGLPKNFGFVDTLGKFLFVDYFFPFEAIGLLFVVALVGALYLAKKGS